MGPKLEAAVKSISDKPVKYVLNTHWHGDHTGGNAYFGKTAVIIGQDNMRMKMAVEHDPRITDLAVSLPAITFSDQFTLHMKSGDIHAIHFEHGHTDGDAVVFFPQDNVVLTGDNFTNFNPPHFPAIDTDNDGTVSLAEAQAGASKVFTTLNTDGMLRAKELKDRLNAAVLGTLDAKQYAKIVQGKFKAADTDNDGTLDEAELSSPAGAVLLKLIQ